MKIKVGICEDDPFTRSTLEASLRHSQVDVSFVSSNAAEAIVLFEQYKPHCMLIDLHLGAGPTGLDLARGLRRANLNLGLVFLTSFESPKILVTGKFDLPSGSRYLVKRDIESVDQIVSELQASLRIGDRPKLPFLGPTSKLTARQLEVLRLIAQGTTNSEIASMLHLQPKTVEGTVSRISKSLGIVAQQNSNQRVQMARAYLRATGELRD